MTKRSKSAKPWVAKIVALRTALGMNQQAFAEKLNASQQAVSAWEGGQLKPAADIFIRLGKLASDSAKLWFWEQAGLGEDDMMPVLEKVQKQRKVPPRAGEIVRVPFLVESDTLPTKGDDAIPLPAAFVPNPASTSAMRVREGFGPTTLRAGDIVVFDQADTAFEKLEGELVAIYHLPERPDVVTARLQKAAERLRGIDVLKDAEAYVRDAAQVVFDAQGALASTAGKGLYVGWLRRKDDGGFSEITLAIPSVEGISRSIRIGFGASSKALAKVAAPRVLDGISLLGRVICWIGSGRAANDKESK